MPETRADSPFPTGTVTFLFTDIEGSTTLWEQYPDTMQVALARHDALLRHAIESSDGRIIKTTGDGVYAVFGAAADALAACLAAQRALQAMKVNVTSVVPAPSGARPPIALRVRMGLHSGVAELRDGDYFGGSLNRAARIMSVAHGEQVLLSAATAEMVRGQLSEGVALREMGEFRLKGLLNPERLLQLVTTDLRSDFPPLASLNAHSLPAERDAFVGRREPLAELARRLDAGARLVSVLGTGGTGKTRLVTRFGWRSLGSFPGGVWFCDLAHARSLDGIVHAVAQGLDLPLGKDDPVTQIGHAIAGRSQCLIILDNFEQVLEHAPATLGRWLNRAVDAAFVVTSRERLHLPGEEVFPIEPLLLGTEAIELFAARANAQRPDFVVNDANHAAVAEVVRLLDGLPLAIELAAARITVLSPAQIIERMQDRFRLLVGARGAAARQATLKAAIDWSWDLLTPWEQAGLAQCSVFEGGFTLVAAEAVLDLARWPEAPPAMNAVQALVDKSLLRAWVPVEQSRYDIDEPYFGMYLSIHEYATEKLDAGGGDATRQAQQRHGTYFATFGTEEAIEAHSRHGGVKLRRALALEIDNLVSACERALQRVDATTAVATYRAAWEVLNFRGPCALGVALGAQVLALDGMAPKLRVPALLTRARASRRAGRLDEASTSLVQALELAKQLGDRRRQAAVRADLGTVDRERGALVEAQGHYEIALTIQREVGNRRSEGVVFQNLGILHGLQGRVQPAHEHYEAALAIHREVGDRLSEGMVLNNLGLLCSEQGRMDEARSHYEASLAIHREAGNRTEEGLVMGNLGILFFERGLLDEALACYERSLGLTREVGNRRFEGMVLSNLGNLHFVQGRVGEAHAHFDACIAIHREVGNRRSEGIVLSNLGRLHQKMGSFEDARRCYQQSLSSHRGLGLRRLEGIVLGYQADLLLEEGKPASAREVLQTGEAALREVRDMFELAKLLSVRCRADLAEGDPDRARATLAEVETMAADAGATPESELVRGIAALRQTLA